MKNILIIVLIFILGNLTINAQNFNWKSLDENQTHIVYLNLGYDFGITTQVGYGYKWNSFRRIVFNADYSFPMGKNLVDDFKIRLGGQIEIFDFHNFILTAKVYAIFRKHANRYVDMSSFGSDFAALIGYYRPTWHIAGVFGFDKSIVTYLKHSEGMKDNFPNITNGWFIPSGGHFYFGLEGSKTIGKNFDISLRLGITDAQGKDVNALLPYYAQLGFTWRFSNKK